jgi:GNAT superfamily N-acetyltransferase
MSLEICSLWERPDLIPVVFSGALDKLWPEFMKHDATAKLYFGPTFENYLRYAFVGMIDGEIVGRAFSVPFAFGFPGRTELPDGGWDQVIRWAHEDTVQDRRPTTMSALEISLLPKARAAGNALALMNALKSRGTAMGFAEMFAPVRPVQKHLQPRTPMSDYIDMKRADGLPADAWLRTHVRSGARIVKVAPYSMTIAGTIDEWAQWTGRRFERSGETEVEGALAPVLVSLEQNYAVYIEPNVWVRHTCTPYSARWEAQSSYSSQSAV